MASFLALYRIAYSCWHRRSRSRMRFHSPLWRHPVHASAGLRRQRLAQGLELGQQIPRAGDLRFGFGQRHSSHAAEHP